MDEIRFREKTVELSNQDIIEIAYMAGDVISSVLGQKLTFDSANCYSHIFYLVKKLFKKVDAEYLEQHVKVVDFYKQDLSSDWDILVLEEPKSLQGIKRQVVARMEEINEQYEVNLKIAWSDPERRAWVNQGTPDKFDSDELVSSEIWEGTTALTRGEILFEDMLPWLYGFEEALKIRLKEIPAPDSNQEEEERKSRLPF